MKTIDVDYILKRIEKIDELYNHLLCQEEENAPFHNIVQNGCKKEYEEFIKDCIWNMEDVAEQNFHKNNPYYKSQIRKCKYLLKQIKEK